jgi:hypothetical protein
VKAPRVSGNRDSCLKRVCPRKGLYECDGAHAYRGVRNCASCFWQSKSGPEGPQCSGLNRFDPPGGANQGHQPRGAPRELVELKLNDCACTFLHSLRQRILFFCLLEDKFVLEADFSKFERAWYVSRFGSIGKAFSLCLGKRGETACPGDFRDGTLV